VRLERFLGDRPSLSAAEVRAFVNVCMPQGDYEKYARTAWTQGETPVRDAPRFVEELAKLTESDHPHHHGLHPVSGFCPTCPICEAEAKRKTA